LTKLVKYVIIKNSAPHGHAGRVRTLAN